ncbi:hypothetical protein E8E11_005238 [Didymella keratinophila]|nr:hypothetical protein E8E11_005238 [Didymella keratinophila]
MDGNWTELETRTINLTEDDPQSFAFYLNLYKNQLPTAALGDDKLSTMTKEAFMAQIAEEYERLSKLYVLAENFQDVPAKKEVLRAVFQLTSARGSPDQNWVRPPVRVIRLLYHNTGQRTRNYSGVISSTKQYANYKRHNGQAWVCWSHDQG